MNKVKIYYQTITPESAQYGEYSETGDHDVLENYTIDDAIRHVKNTYGSLEPSSSPGFCKNIWYTTRDPDIDFRTGEETYYTIHLDSYSEKEQRDFFDKIKK